MIINQFPLRNTDDDWLLQDKIVLFLLDVIKRRSESIPLLPISVAISAVLQKILQVKIWVRIAERI